MRPLVFLVLIAFSFNSFSQNISVHQQESEYYASFGEKADAFWDSLSGYKPLNTPQEKTCNLNKIVFGWHPYWVGSVYTNYHWDLLSH